MPDAIVTADSVVITAPTVDGFIGSPSGRLNFRRPDGSDNMRREKSEGRRKEQKIEGAGVGGPASGQARSAGQAAGRLWRCWP
jgi:hypothetical protein